MLGGVLCTETSARARHENISNGRRHVPVVDEIKSNTGDIYCHDEALTDMRNTGSSGGEEVGRKIKNI